MATPALLFLSLRIVTLAEAEQQAAEHQPNILQAVAQTEAARARQYEALAPLLPQVNATGQYQRRTQNQPACNPNFVDCSKQPMPMTATKQNNTLTSIDYFSFGATASQLIWDFNLTRDQYRAAMRRVDAQVATEELSRQTALQVVRNAFFTAHANKALVGVAKETVANDQRHLDQIEGFVKVGKNAEIDLAQTRSQLATARLLLINAENNYDTAKAQLNQAMGVTSDIEYDVSDDEVPVIDGEDGPLDGLVVEAAKARPDLTSILASLRAQELIISSYKGNYWPSFNAGLGFTATGTDLSVMAYNGSASIGGSWGLFSGGLTMAQVREQRANLAALQAQIEGLRLQVRLDVEQARLAVRAAKASIVAADEALFNAKEQLRLAEGRYSAGVGSIIELGDAQVAYTTAAAQKVQYENNVGIARAQLLRALGRK